MYDKFKNIDLSKVTFKKSQGGTIIDMHDADGTFIDRISMQKTSTQTLQEMLDSRVKSTKKSFDDAAIAHNVALAYQAGFEKADIDSTI